MDAGPLRGLGAISVTTSVHALETLGYPVNLSCHARCFGSLFGAKAIALTSGQMPPGQQNVTAHFSATDARGMYHQPHCS
jgi:hypothetical protein